MTVTEVKERFSVNQVRDMLLEHQKMLGIFKEVEKRIGITRKIELRIDPHLEKLAGNHTASATTLDGTIDPIIAYTPGILSVMSPFQLAGILAHEIGHLVMKHTENMDKQTQEDRYQNEIDADLFAAEFGFARNLIDSFEFAKTLIPQKFWNAAGPMHPPIQFRIQLLEHYLKRFQTEKKAA